MSRVSAVNNDAQFAKLIKLALLSKDKDGDADLDELFNLSNKFYKLKGASEYMANYMKEHLPVMPDDYLIKYTIDILKWYQSFDARLKVSPELVKKILEKEFLTGEIFDSDMLLIAKYGWKESAMSDSSPMSNIVELIEIHFDENNEDENEDDEE